MSGTRMRLFVVDEGKDVFTWVSARNPVDAIMCYAENCGVDTFDGEESVSSREVDEAEGRRLTYVDSDSETERPMWDEWQKDPKRGVIASSEW